MVENWNIIEKWPGAAPAWVVPVYIRTEDGGTTRAYVTSVPIGNVSSVINIIKRHGVQDQGTDFSGTFVLDGDTLIFEILVSVPDD